MTMFENKFIVIVIANLDQRLWNREIDKVDKIIVGLRQRPILQTGRRRLAFFFLILPCLKCTLIKLDKDTLR